MELRYEEIAKMIDHSLLQPQLTDRELEEGCRLAAHYGVASVYVKPYFVRRAARLLRHTDVAVGTTVGFPHGAHTLGTKVYEAQEALEHGATELDMVCNLGKVLERQWSYVSSEIQAILEAALPWKAMVKVIFENGYLQDDHKKELCRICSEVRVHFVKTSTGYGPSGATVEDVRLMRRCCAPEVQVKAAGGIRDLGTLLAMRAAGASRIGATQTAAILETLKQRLQQAAPP